MLGVTQLHVDRHLMGSIHPMEEKPPQTQVIVHTMTRTSEYLTQPHWESQTITMGNDISINYIYILVECLCVAAAISNILLLLYINMYRKDN